MGGTSSRFELVVRLSAIARGSSSSIVFYTLVCCCSPKCGWWWYSFVAFLLTSSAVARTYFDRMGLSSAQTDARLGNLARSRDDKFLLPTTGRKWHVARQTAASKTERIGTRKSIVFWYSRSVRLQTSSIIPNHTQKPSCFISLPNYKLSEQKPCRQRKTPSTKPQLPQFQVDHPLETNERRVSIRQHITKLTTTMESMILAWAKPPVVGRRAKKWRGDKITGEALVDRGQFIRRSMYEPRKHSKNRPKRSKGIFRQP